MSQQLDAAREQVRQRGQDPAVVAIEALRGAILDFAGERGFDLKLESLESRSAGIELLSFRIVDDVPHAIVYVPEGQFEYFIERVEQYLTKDTDTGKPRNRLLVESISDIQLAYLRSLWTDTWDTYPADGTRVWLEVWLRRGSDPDAILDAFQRLAHVHGITLGKTTLTFPGRTVLLAWTGIEQLAASPALLNCLAEVRRAKDTADDFRSMTPSEQHAWAREAVGRVQPIPAGAPAVTVLDTGVNRGHPMLALALAEEDAQACDPTWGSHDHHGHGTEMAGLALYGELTDVMRSTDPIVLRHRLESVKILPPVGDNPPELYGAITAEAVARVEVTAPHRQRVVCMAVTADGRDRGMPSSWSAEVDKLAAGVDDGTRRLLVVAAGNTTGDGHQHYPNSNQTEGIHDPGQAWNALTVGASTHKWEVDPDKFLDYHPVAPVGDLSPSSCTSTPWDPQWPLKPDVVFEGGNMAIRPLYGTATYLDTLQLLTTGHNYLLSPFSVTGDTSAATALASRMAASIQAEYPDLWPEAVRALMVHSAEWTQSMRSRSEGWGKQRGQKIGSLLRYCGHGTPSLERALWSGRNAVTLIAQEELQPFEFRDGEYRSKELRIHALPWPADVLLGLGDVPVDLRITLSYFIEPNPARRGWTRRHRYASHGLRFDVKTPSETLVQFRKRINKAALEAEEKPDTKSDSSDWLLGSQLRGLGSVHSDTWSGTAADLATREYLAVFPIIGWWREQPLEGRWDTKARYALVVSLRTPATHVDLYTPVRTLIAAPVHVQI